MLAVSPVPVPDTGARASDGAHGWTRVLSTYPCVNQAEQVITGARSAVQSIGAVRSIPGQAVDGECLLAVCSATQEAMIGKAFALIGAAYHHLTTSSPKLFLPKPDMHLTCHHRNALLAIARWHVAQVWLGAATEPELTIFRGVHPTLDAITKVSRTCSTRCRLRCATRCVREHMRAGAQSRRCCATFRQARRPKPSHLYWGKSIFRDRLSAFCIMEEKTTPRCTRFWTIRSRPTWVQRTPDCACGRRGAQPSPRKGVPGGADQVRRGCWRRDTYTTATTRSAFLGSGLSACCQSWCSPFNVLTRQRERTIPRVESCTMFTHAHTFFQK